MIAYRVKDKKRSLIGIVADIRTAIASWPKFIKIFKRKKQITYLITQIIVLIWTCQ